ncbi:transcriptional regulator of acetoin/glycerol metabolism [Saccharomonospora amisosensis]|uniref:Transcriptional regulator of acetoin/glycerol metabolism n=1 Tax=Saccharomonospora amisosensis TaxID=1128677 RepID=A0A7X5URR5_9PSEU|nr:helix-turn-helix domain-containing protein [Saccharomonospora amisosensis]NIJ12553.1 transcriptional regulator of acetoin/glycerol metabolism [Saccharomonospora amisosensis]
MTAHPPPRTTAEWDRVREAKRRVLTSDPFSVDPADHPDVRPQIVASWRRSMLAGVDPEARHYEIDESFQPGTRLGAVAQPIMNRLQGEISDLSCWGFLADRACRLLTVVVGDFPQAARVHRQNLRPGMCFAEEVMGTNGMGCAHETQRAFLISGAEHFRSDAEILTTTGVIIRDPLTKRYVGTLGAHCLREYGTTALLPLVVEIGRSIEAQLLESRSDGEREFFDAFTAARRRNRAPVVGVSRQLCVVSTRARALVHEADEEMLRLLAKEAGSRSGTVRRNLSSGVTVTIRVHPVPQPNGEFAAILVLQPVGERTGGRRGGSRASEEPLADFRAAMRRAIGQRRPTLLTGERGCGKRHEAQALLRATAHPGAHPDDVVELDGAHARLDPNGWLRRLTAAMRAGDASVLLAHVTDLPTELASPVVSLVRDSRVPLIATADDDEAQDRAALLVRESFPVLLTVPPLRDRREEFATLCASLLAQVSEPGEEPPTLTRRALAALLASDWPGNLRQLSQVLSSARVRVAGPVIDLADLPSHYHRHQQAHPLDEVRNAERRVLLAALREAGGDRAAAARKLGISRATVYRKLKRYESH